MQYYQFGQFVAQQNTKQAGLWSELAGTVLSPVNYFAPAAPLAVGGALSLATDTRSDEEQKENDSSMWKNLLIPGVGPYNLWKRLGNKLRGPKALQEAKKQYEEEATKLYKAYAEKVKSKQVPAIDVLGQIIDKQYFIDRLADKDYRPKGVLIRTKGADPLKLYDSIMRDPLGTYYD